MKRLFALFLLVGSIALATPPPAAVENVPASKVYGSVSTKTGNYTSVEDDSGQTIVLNGTSITLTLPAAPPNTNWNITVININSTSATISRNGLNINGAAANLTLAQNTSTKITTDGSNYFSASGGGAGGITSISTTSPISGGPITTTGTLSLLTNVDFSFTNLQTYTISALGTTLADAIILKNATAATAGVPNQYSPAIHLEGAVWNTTATAASNLTDWYLQTRSSSGTSPTSVLSVLNQMNGGTLNELYKFWSDGHSQVLPPMTANTEADGMTFYDNSGPASSGNQFYSPAVVWTGFGWKTNATAASREVDFRSYLVPVQGTTNPTGYLTFESQVNAGGFGNPLNFFTSGGLSLGTTTDPGAGIINANTGFEIAGAAASGKILIGDGTKFVASTPTYPNASATSGKILQSDGTNFISSTMTWPSGAAPTSGKVAISDGTNMVASTPTFPNASATSGKIIKSDGTNWTASTETYAVPGANGNVMTSDGTNWTSAAATSGASTPGSALFTSTADASNVHLTADTTLVGTGSGSATTAANYFKVGTTMIFIGEGYYSTATVTPATLNIKLKAGSTVVATTGAQTPTANITNGTWRLIATVTCRTTGASGTFQVNTLFEQSGSALVPNEAPMLNTSTITLDTTATQAWDLDAAWGATTAGDTITGTNFTMYTPGSAVATDVQILSPAASPAPSPTPCTSNGCTQSYTWTKPASGNSTWVYLVGAGGGGGGGDFNTGTSTAHCGGGGGGAGAFTKNVFPTALLGSTETVTVGIGGAGGAAKTSNASGGVGINGGATSFGTWLTASQGTGGGGGTSGATCAGTLGSGGSGELAGGNGAAASTSGAVGNTPAASNTFNAAGGASGGGITTGNAGAGGAVGAASANNTKATPLAGGTAGSGPSTAGGAGTSAGAGEPQGGAGGGSGGCAATPAGGSDGGAGGLYGGGGGGGGAGEATTSGAGGHGGYGVAVIITTN